MILQAKKYITRLCEGRPCGPNETQRPSRNAGNFAAASKATPHIETTMATMMDEKVPSAVATRKNIPSDSGSNTTVRFTSALDFPIRFSSVLNTKLRGALLVSSAGARESIPTPTATITTRVPELGITRSTMVMTIAVIARPPMSAQRPIDFFLEATAANYGETQCHYHRTQPEPD